MKTDRQLEQEFAEIRAQITGGRHYRTDTEDPQLEERERSVMFQLQKLLEDFYPTSYFNVRVSLEKTYPYVLVGLDGFHSSTWGKFINIAECWAQPNDLRKKVMEAGGELLERFNIPRHKQSIDAYLELMHPLGYRMGIPD